AVEVAPELCRVEDGTAVCAVRKDAGDDPDVTDGMLVYAAVSQTARGLEIDGGEGVGRVTRAGLDQPIGAAAINSVPRRMIAAAAENVCAEYAYAGGLRIVVSIPGGEERARKTFNPALGIEGGLSVLGTSGIVEPMSEQAIVDTIAVEMRQARLAGDRLLLVPGNYGMDFVTERFPALSALPRVKISNYVGDAIDLAVMEGFAGVILVGHIGKLVKLAGGIMNTHSHTADCRMELLCAHAALCGAPQEVCAALMRQVTTDGCLAVLETAGLREPVLASLLQAIQSQLDRRGACTLPVGAILFSNEYGLLGLTAGASRLLREWEAGQENA
ncbi:MAG: cobalamin biosynthesis protein CbiD, partial [Oscillospiraceae bacterium]|nr:cobalamin biosynthesis protein CbiD [Oscillospiraceae bacterium]